MDATLVRCWRNLKDMLIALNIVLSSLNLVIYIDGKKRGKANPLNLFVAGFCAAVALAIALM